MYCKYIFINIEQSKCMQLQTAFYLLTPMFCLVVEHNYIAQVALSLSTTPQLQLRKPLPRQKPTNVICTRF